MISRMLDREKFVGDVLPYPALLSAPVTLTLALSRRAGEGICPIAHPVLRVFKSRGVGLLRDCPSLSNVRKI